MKRVSSNPFACHIGSSKRKSYAETANDGIDRTGATTESRRSADRSSQLSTWRGGEEEGEGEEKKECEYSTTYYRLLGKKQNDDDRHRY